MTGAGVFGVVIGKLCHRKKLCLVILLKIDKGLVVCFHCIILPFGFAIRLQVKVGEESLYDV